VSVPDEVEPRAGWRVWDIVELDGSLRLCSLAFWTIWLPKREASATCRRSLLDAALTRLPPHPAPQARCTCGIYATETAAQVLDFSRTVKHRLDTVHRVPGRVSLWGTVIECEGGWRAARAYPAQLYVPTARPQGFWRRGRFRRSHLPIEEIVFGLADYGVPVEVVDCASQRELARLLEPPSLPPADDRAYRR
jgi:hypothetical protein